jgi:hypothetical protein
VDGGDEYGASHRHNDGIREVEIQRKCGFSHGNWFSEPAAAGYLQEWPIWEQHTNLVGLKGSLL